MPNTPYWEWSYPPEDLDPHFDELTEFFDQISETVYALAGVAANIVIPPDSYAYDAVSGIFSWTGTWQIPILGSGFFLNIATGPDKATPHIVLNEGDRIIVTVPNTSGANVSAYFSAVNGSYPAANGTFTLGMRKNNKLYLNIPLALG